MDEQSNTANETRKISREDKDDVGGEDLNYSFLAKLFSGLSDQQKEKIMQVLKNTRTLEKTG